MQHQVVAFVLAGGKGNRLLPLTQERAKPAVPLGASIASLISFSAISLIRAFIRSTCLSSS